MEAKVIKSNETKVFMDGPEVCCEYIKTNKITFGTSSLLPGQTGAVDPGHSNSHEIFYVSRGEVLMHTPNDGKYYQSESVPVSQRSGRIRKTACTQRLDNADNQSTYESARNGSHSSQDNDDK